MRHISQVFNVQRVYIVIERIYIIVQVWREFAA